MWNQRVWSGGSLLLFECCGDMYGLTALFTSSVSSGNINSTSSSSSSLLVDTASETTRETDVQLHAFCLVPCGSLTGATLDITGKDKNHERPWSRPRRILAMNLSELDHDVWPWPWVTLTMSPTDSRDGSEQEPHPQIELSFSDLHCHLKYPLPDPTFSWAWRKWGLMRTKVLAAVWAMSHLCSSRQLSTQKKWEWSETARPALVQAACCCWSTQVRWLSTPLVLGRVRCPLCKMEKLGILAMNSDLTNIL